MLQLSKDELEIWRSQLVTSNLQTKMSLRRPPNAFTEHGVTMLASVLKNDQAVEMSIRIVRAFVQMRELAAEHRDLTARSSGSSGSRNNTPPSSTSSPKRSRG